MEKNLNRNVFGLHGIFGVLISIVGLLIILIGLMIAAVSTERNSAANPYDPTQIRDIHTLKQISQENKHFSFQTPKESK
jgi:hypothetical protein